MTDEKLGDLVQLLQTHTALGRLTHTEATDVARLAYEAFMSPGGCGAEIVAKWKAPTETVTMGKASA